MPDFIFWNGPYVLAVVNMLLWYPITRAKPDSRLASLFFWESVTVAGLGVLSLLP